VHPDSRYTDGSYERDNPDWHAGNAEHKAQAVLRMLQRVGWTPHDFLDIGCGTGDVLKQLCKQRDVRGIGWDIAKRPIDDERTQFHRGDGVSAASPADIVLCLDVFEHVADDEAFLRQLRKLGDRFIFRVPLDLSAWDLVRGRQLRHAREAYGHLHVYDRYLAEELLGRCGYQVECVAYDRTPRPMRGLEVVRRALFPIAPRATAQWLGGFSLVIAAR